MPWPFDDSGDPFKRRDFFRDFDKEFKEVFKLFDDLHTDPFARGQQNRNSDHEDRRPFKIENPRSYLLHDPRHSKERRAHPIIKPLPKSDVADTEVNIGNNYNALLANEDREVSQPYSSNTRESISTTWTMRNGKMCKQERREQTVGRQRRVSITSTDENGNTTTNEYTEEL